MDMSHRNSNSIRPASWHPGSLNSIGPSFTNGFSGTVVKEGTDLIIHVEDFFAVMPLSVTTTLLQVENKFVAKNY